MFARISGSVASDLIDEGPSSYPANAWIWSEQTIAAQRRRFGCAPLQPSSKASSSSGQDHHRAALVVCYASSSRRHKAAQAPLRRPSKCRNASAGYLRTSLHNASNSGGLLCRAPPQQQQRQQQVPVTPSALTACISAALHYHELEALCNTFLNNPSFGIQHAALVLSRLHKVHGRAQDSRLLLVELLAAKVQSSFSAAAATAVATAAVTENSQQLRLLCPDEVAAVCWSFAKVGYQPHAGLLQPLLQQFWSGFDHEQQKQQKQQKQQREFQQGSTCHLGALSQLAAGLAGLGVRDPAVWAQLQATAVETAAHMQPACLQQLVWAVATAQVSDAATTDALANAVLQRIEQFKAEELAQVVWCFHVLGYDRSELYEQAAQQMVGWVEAAAGCCIGSSSNQAAGKSKADAGIAADEQVQQADTSPGCTIAHHTSNKRQQEELQQACVQPRQLQQQQPLMQRPRLSLAQQDLPKLQHIALQLPQHALPQQHDSSSMQNVGMQRHSAAHGSLGRTAADLYSAAASQAYSVLEKYDPVLCTLALYRDYFQPAQASWTG